MTFYAALRHFADSWFLIVMFGMFALFCLWPFRPGSKQRNENAANVIFKDDDHGE